METTVRRFLIIIYAAISSDLKGRVMMKRFATMFLTILFLTMNVSIAFAQEGEIATPTLVSHAIEKINAS